MISSPLDPAAPVTLGAGLLGGGLCRLQQVLTVHRQPAPLQAAGVPGVGTPPPSKQGGGSDAAQSTGPDPKLFSVILPSKLKWGSYALLE